MTVAESTLCVVDPEGNVIEGSQRRVDFHNRRDHYFKMLAELEAAKGDGCEVIDTATHRRDE